MTFDITTIYFSMLVFMRASALLMIMPLVSGRMIPMPVRMALGFFIAYSVYATVPVTGEMPAGVVLVIINLLHELLLGVFMGFAVRMVFYAIEVAGQVIAIESGLAMTTALDPFSDLNSSIYGRILYLFGIVLFFSVGLQYEVLSHFAASFGVIPAGAGIPLDGDITRYLMDTAEVFVVGVKMAAPFIAVNFVINITFAVLGKTAPKMNVLMVSFAVRVWVGFFVFMLSLGLLTEYIHRSASKGPGRMIEYLNF